MFKKDWTIARLVLAPAVAVAIVGAVGCSTGEARVTVEVPSPETVKSDDYKLVQLDDSFGDKVAIGRVARRDIDGFLQVQVTLVSTTSKPLAIETAWEWFDREGFKVESGRDGWIPAEMGARTSLEVKGMAPTAQVTSFKFHVRAAMPIRG